MQRDDLTFDVIEVLKEVAAKFQPELLQRVRAELGARDLKLFDCVFGQYYQKETLGRWYDPYHVVYSTHFVVQLEKTSLVVPAIILHDLGYSVLSEEMKEGWDDVQVRIIHMQEGAAIAARILVGLGSYNAREIESIVGMVATHDNGYLKPEIETKNPVRLTLRDADRIWVMHFLSFYKDWVSGSNQDLSLQDFYNSRWDRLYNETKLFFYTDMAERWRDRQFRTRYQEIQDNIIRDRDIFQKYAEKHIRSELKVGRG